MQTIIDPGLWIGTEWYQRTDALHTLTREQQQALLAWVQQTAAPFVHTQPWLQRHSDQAIAWAGFPASVQTLLQRCQTALEVGPGFVVVRGLPVQALNFAEQCYLFWALGTRLGTPVSQKPEGERLLSVQDQGLQLGQKGARGVNTHEELAFHNDRSDVLALCCVHKALSGGENRVVHALAVYNALLADEPALLAELLQPFYYRRHNYEPATVAPYYPLPIFAQQAGHWLSYYVRPYIQLAQKNPEVPRLTSRQVAALDCLDAYAAKLAVNFTQEPGDVVLLNNYVTYHSRTAFVDSPNPAQRRHLLRLWLAVPNSRPLPAAFAAIVGDVRAGVVRGGF